MCFTATRYKRQFELGGDARTKTAKPDEQLVESLTRPFSEDKGFEFQRG